MIEMTDDGAAHIPRVPHHFPAWGGIKELFRVKKLKGEPVLRKDIEEILGYCGHPKDRHDPNGDYLGYAIKSGWLTET